MKYLKIFLFWIGLSLLVGLLVKFSTSEINGNGIFVVFISIGFIIGSISVFLSYLSARNKIKIFDEAMKMYHGKVNSNGETELRIKEKSVILDYKLDQFGMKVTQYIIANIDFTDVKKPLLENCKYKFDIIEKNHRTYVVIYCSWGYKGKRFKERVENKIEQINECVKLKTDTNQMGG